MRDAVSMPRSPTSTTCWRPNRSRIFVTLAGHGLRVGGRALEDLDGDRAALGRAEQAEDDLQGALLAVAAVAAPGERAVGPLDVAGGEVVEHQSVLLQVALGEALLDGGLSGYEPVHGGVEFVRVEVAESECLAEGGDGALGGEGAGGGELGLGIDDPVDEEREHEVAAAAGLAVDEGMQSELPEGAEDGGDVSVGQTSDAGEGVFGIDELLAAEDAAERLDGGGGELGEVGEGALLDAAVFAVGLAEEDGGRGGAIGHALDIHGYPLYHTPPTITGTLTAFQRALHGYKSRLRSRPTRAKPFRSNSCGESAAETSG